MKTSLQMGQLPAAGSSPPAAKGDGSGWYVALGLLVIGTVFGGLTAWSILAPIEGATIAIGTVQVESNRKAIQHLEGGIVHNLAVRDGDRVETGQLLIQLDDTVARAQLGVIDARLHDQLARRARLVAERDDKTELLVPRQFAARMDDPAIAEIWQGQRGLFKARRASRETEVDLLKQRIKQLQEQVVGETAQRDAKVTQIKIMRDELTDLRGLLERGIARRPRVRQMERQEAQLVGDKGQHIAAIAEARTGISEAKMRILGLTKGFREQVLTELREVQSEISGLMERRVTALDALSRAQIKAPRSGRVLAMQVHTIGGVVSPGQPILHIVPDDDKLVISAQVRPDDIDKVRPGDETLVRFPVLTKRFTPEAIGYVTKVSADTLQQQNGANYYTATIEMDAESLAQAGVGKGDLLPGMPTEAFIKTEARTVVSYLIKPLRDALAHAFRG